MASGALPPNSPAPGFKFFFYGIEPESLAGADLLMGGGGADSATVYLVQMVVSALAEGGVAGRGGADVTVVVKTSNTANAAAAGQSMVNLMMFALRSLQ